MNMTRQIVFIALSFILGIASYNLYQRFINPCPPFPNFPTKYKYPAILTPEMALEYYKASDKPMPPCAPPKTVIL